MMTMPASSLQAGDVFTDDNGETWHKIVRVTLANRGERVIVISKWETVPAEHIFKSDAEVVVKF